MQFRRCPIVRDFRKGSGGAFAGVRPGPSSGQCGTTESQAPGLSNCRWEMHQLGPWGPSWGGGVAGRAARLGLVAVLVFSSLGSLLLKRSVLVRVHGT